jgi:hypothetical protein
MVASQRPNPAAIIRALLRPIARLCLERGVRLREFEQLFREVLVEQAQELITASSNTVSVSKLSITTGLHRTEVARLVRGETREEDKHDVLTRVIGLWSQAKRYQEASGDPKLLTYEGTSSQFAKLVESVTKEGSHYPLLFELERLGFIEYKDGLVALKVADYTPEPDMERACDILSADVIDLANTIEGNVVDGQESAQLHLRTVYDNISSDELPSIKRWLRERGAEFHAAMRAYLSKLDRDITPTSTEQEGTRTRVAITTFACSQEQQPPKIIKPKKRGRKPCSP